MTMFSAAKLDPTIPRHGLRIVAGKIWKKLGLPRIFPAKKERNWKLQNPEEYRKSYTEYNRRPEVRARANQRNAHAYQEKRAWLDAQKSARPCKDCNRFFPACCMDYDHLPGCIKAENLSKMVGKPECKIADMEAEITKCELVCANCHRIRSYITRKENNYARPK